jgi:hypothetical protein
MLHAVLKELWPQLNTQQLELLSPPHHAATSSGEQGQQHDQQLKMGHSVNITY